MTATAASVVMVGAVALVAADALTSHSGPVRACESAKGYLSLASDDGKCAKGERGVTIDQRGPRGATGARGIPGPAGAVSAFFRSSTATLGSAATGEHGIYPSTVETDEIDGIPAGTYLISGSVQAANLSTTTAADIQCGVGPVNSTNATQVGGGWQEDIDPAGAKTDDNPRGEGGGALNGYVHFPSAANGVRVRCFNFSVTGAATTIDVDVTLTRVAKLTVPKG